MGRPAGGRSFDTIVERIFRFAILWLLFGIQKRDKNIYLPCMGWIVLDIGVIAGVIVYG